MTLVGRLVLSTAVVGLVVAILLPPPATRVITDEASLPGVRGVLHVHTRRSDGTGTVADVARAAFRAGVQVVVITDHGDGTRTPDPPVYLNGVLCIDGVEISSDDGHVVVIGMAAAPYPLGGAASDVVEDAHRLGGWTVAAHPGSPKPELAWRDWTVPVDAIEWLNGDSEWRDEGITSLVRTLLGYPFRPGESLATLIDRPAPVIARWDTLQRERSVVGVAAADAHARVGLTSLGEPYDSRVSLPLPSYEAVFSALSVTIGAELTGDAAVDATTVMTALRVGRVHSSVDGWARGGRLRFWAESGAERVYEGGRVVGSDQTTLHVEVQAPSGAMMTLLRDGMPIRTAPPPTLDLPVPADRASYRVEVTLPGASARTSVPWLLSNAIHIGGAQPSTRQATSLGTRVRPFGRDTLEAAQIERARGSEGALSVTGAPNGTELLFRYALGGRAVDDPYAAIALPLPGPIASTTSLRFTARADRPMRLSVQLRRLDGRVGERWRQSVYLDDTPRQVSVRVSDMRRVEGASSVGDRRTAADAVLFVVDDVNTPLGPGGRVWLDGLALVD
jgi:hypothetical protein